MDTEAEKDQVRKTIKRWAKAFGTKDLAGILAEWDLDYPHIVYQAEEYPDPLRGAKEIEFYYRGITQLAQNLRGQSVIDFDVDVIGEVAWCYLRGTITFDILNSEQKVSGEVRQTFLLRKTERGWKIIQYHDSRETPDLRRPLLSAHPRSETLQ